MTTLVCRTNSRSCRTFLYLLAAACPFALLAACTESTSEESEGAVGIAGSAGTAGTAHNIPNWHPAVASAGIAGNVTSARATTFATGGAASVISSAVTPSSVNVAGAAGAPIAAGFAGSAAVASTPVCIATSDDDAPDPNGEDLNCDGIDGTVSRSVFVSPDGLDSAVGTLDDPVRTIGKAVTLAQASGGKRTDVLICAATYPENVLVTGTGVGLHGGYDCSTWKRTASKPLVAPTSGVPLRIAAVTEPMSVSRLSFKAPDATGFGESSHGVQIINSQRVRIEQSIIVAGRGGLGAAGKVQIQTWDGTKPLDAASGEALEIGADGSVGCHTGDENVDVDFDGKLDFSAGDATSKRCTVPRKGGDSSSRVCKRGDGTSYMVRGGKGGSGAVKPLDGAVIESTAGTVGDPALDPTHNNQGAPGKAFGTVTERGYEATNAGTDGSDGLPGKSGVGGKGGISCLVRSSNIVKADIRVEGTTERYAGKNCENVAWGEGDWSDFSQPYSGRTVSMFPGSGGGQGGYGGCGGYKGFGGGAGGGSIGLFVFNSKVELTWTDISASRGGDGGAPSEGTEGQPGGAGGDGGAVVFAGTGLPIVNNQPLIEESTLKGRTGSPGSKGQRGDAGGPGGGGPSVAVLWKGERPTIDSSVNLKSELAGNGASAITGDPGATGISSNDVDASAM